MQRAATKMTYDQYCLLPEDRNRYQLFDGELVMTPSPRPKHQEIVVRLTALLEQFVKRSSLGKVFAAPLDVVLDENTVVQPDVFFIRRERLNIVGEDYVEAAPDLVVEVLSPSTFHIDLRRKMKTYSRFGVQEYWIVDPEEQVVEVFRRSGDKLQPAAKFSEGQILESPLLPGFRLSVREIF
jgi:Uma2 family endonuclease